MSRLIEKYIQVVRVAGLNTKKAVDFSQAPLVALPAGTTVGGSPIAGSVPYIFTGADANALAVGLNGSTNPALNIDTSTASSATGIQIKSAAAGGGVALTTLSSAASESLTISSKGASGVLTLTGLTAISMTGGRTQITGNAANQFCVGANGNTNSALNVNCSVTSQATGLNVIGRAAGANVSLVAISSGTNESMTIDGKGTGTVILQSATAVPAGGSAQASVLMSTTASLGVYFGSGAPTVSAAQGSVYTRTDGSSTSTRLYVNTNGSTTWTNVTTAA